MSSYVASLANSVVAGARAAILAQRYVVAMEAAVLATIRCAARESVVKRGPPVVTESAVKSNISNVPWVGHIQIWNHEKML